MWRFHQSQYRGLPKLHVTKYIGCNLQIETYLARLWLGTLGDASKFQSLVRCRPGSDYNFGFASTTVCERGLSKHNWVKSDRMSRLKPEISDALMRVSSCGLPMENMEWAGIFGTWKSTNNRRAFTFGVGWYINALSREQIVHHFYLQRDQYQVFLSEVLQNHL